MLRATFSRLRSEGEEGEEGVPRRVKLLVALIILFALLWQVRSPIVRFACGQEWLSAPTCSALLPAGTASPGVTFSADKVN